MRKFFANILAIFFVISVTTDAFAQTTFTWTGGAGDGKWSSPTNWSPNGIPGSSDGVVFDSTSVTSSSVDTSFAGSIKDLTIASGYTGTITLGRTLATKTFFQTDGTFTANGFDTHFEGTFNIVGGTFDAGSGVLTHDGTGADYFYVTDDGVFEQNSGTIKFLGVGYRIKVSPATDPVTLQGRTGNHFNNVVIGAGDKCDGTNSSWKQIWAGMDIRGNLTVSSEDGSGSCIARMSTRANPVSTINIAVAGNLIIPSSSKPIEITDDQVSGGDMHLFIAGNIDSQNLAKRSYISTDVDLSGNLTNALVFDPALTTDDLGVKFTDGTFRLV